MKSISDSALVSLYQAGDQKALEILISRHQKDLFTFIFYKVLDDDLANDIFQDTFMKIIVTLKKGNYNEEGKFILWAKRIAHNLIIDHFRVKSKTIKVSETTYDNEEFSIFDLVREPSDNIEDQLVKEQILEDLMRLLVLLPANQQEVIKLRFYDGLSFKEIADQTETSINTTLGRVRYALINLRKLIAENKIILTK